jgi:hypothetical protein
MFFVCIMKILEAGLTLIIHDVRYFLIRFFWFFSSNITVFLQSLHVYIFGFLGFQRKKDEKFDFLIVRPLKTFNLLRNIFQTNNA